MRKASQQVTQWWRRLFGQRGDAGEREADERLLADIGYTPRVNQVRHEPMPASEHDDQRQEAVVRNEELGVPARGQDAGPLYESEQHGPATRP
jgi:hypothetical protein